MCFKAGDTNICIGHGVLSALDEQLDTITANKYLFTDTNIWQEVGDLWKQRIHSLPAPFFRFKSGEEFKQIKEVELAWQALLKAGAERSDILINLGGGVVCDMAGFTAATFKRGLRFIQVPTSLLAMADASVGGKTAVNLGKEKNMVGVFAHPEEVYMDLDFLSYLSESELFSGAAEILKMQLIMCGEFNKDRWQNIFNFDNFPQEALEQAVRWKTEVVEDDFKEEGRRRILNFGHTFGHALETLYLRRKTPIPHGWAVAWGMVFELYLSVKYKGFPLELFKKIRDIIENYFGCPIYRESDYSLLVEYMLHDKKTKGAEIRPILLSELGCPDYEFSLTTEKALEHLKDGDIIYTV